jgi:hypothetical protein
MMKTNSRVGLFKPCLAALGVWLALATGPAAVADVLLDVSSSLSFSDPTQLGRLSRSGTASIWSSAKAFPGTINTNTSYHFRAISVFSSPTAQYFDLSSRYVQVLVEDSSAAVFVSAYLQSYNPNPIGNNRGLDVNYLGDAGSSGDPRASDPNYFQVFVPAGHDLILVVGDVDASNGGIGKPFRVLVEGFTDTEFSDTRPTILSTTVSNAAVVLNATNGIAGRTYDVLTSTNVALPLGQWAPIATNVPGQSGSFMLTLTNMVNLPGRQRFFILGSPED